MSDKTKVEIMKSKYPNKKFTIILYYPDDGKKRKTLQIGQAGAEDVTLGASETKKNSYIKRHQAKENHGISGIATRGFWALHLLWNKPTITESIKDIEKKFNVDIVYKN
jgi:hypothetical protein